LRARDAPSKRGALRDRPANRIHFKGLSAILAAPYYVRRSIIVEFLYKPDFCALPRYVEQTLKH
jgi:hypothetical protein